MNGYGILYNEENKCCTFCTGSFTPTFKGNVDFCKQCHSDSDGTITLLNFSKNFDIWINAKKQYIHLYIKDVVAENHPYIGELDLPWSIIDESNNFTQVLDKIKIYINRYIKLIGFQ
jgi:hypothetical protein